MDIIIQGKQNEQALLQSLDGVLSMLKARYHITGYHDIHMHVTLLDGHGDEVELVDTNTHQVYRIFEVSSQGPVLSTGRRIYPELRLVVDNTRL